MADYILAKFLPFEWSEVRAFVIYEGGTWIFTTPNEPPLSPIVFGVRLKDGRMWNVRDGFKVLQ